MAARGWEVRHNGRKAVAKQNQYVFDYYEGILHS